MNNVILDQENAFPINKKTDPGTRRDEGLAVSVLSRSREEMRLEFILRQRFHPQKLKIGFNPWERTDTVYHDGISGNAISSFCPSPCDPAYFR